MGKPKAFCTFLLTNLFIVSTGVRQSLALHSTKLRAPAQSSQNETLNRSAAETFEMENKLEEILAKAAAITPELSRFGYALAERQIFEGRVQEAIWTLDRTGWDSSKVVEQVRKRLVNENIVGIKKIGTGKDGALLIVLESGMMAVAKSGALTSLQAVNSEVLSHLIDVDTHLNTVPVTVQRRIDNELFSFQLFMPNAKPTGRGHVNDGQNYTHQEASMYFLDFQSMQQDRTPPNVLQTRSGRIVAIDNGNAAWDGRPSITRNRQLIDFDGSVFDLNLPEIARWKEKLAEFSPEDFARKNEIAFAIAGVDVDRWLEKFVQVRKWMPALGTRHSNDQQPVAELPFFNKPKAKVAKEWLTANGYIVSPTPEEVRVIASSLKKKVVQLARKADFAGLKSEFQKLLKYDGEWFYPMHMKLAVESINELIEGKPEKSKELQSLLLNSKWKKYFSEGGIALLLQMESKKSIQLKPGRCEDLL